MPDRIFLYMDEGQDRRPPQAVTGKLRRHLRILVDLGRLASQQVNLEGFLDQTVTQVGRAVEIDHVKILRYRAKRADLLAVAGIGWKPGVVGNARFPSHLSSPPGRAFQTGEPVVIGDAAKAPEFKFSPVLKEHGIVALANVPVMAGGATWGVLEVDSTEPRQFSSDTVTFLSAAATIVGLVIQRHREASSAGEKLASAVAETQARDVLLSEMQHRVKNNLQIVLSMIALQKRRLPTGEAQRALDHVANRISAISLAHNQLDLRQGAHAVGLAGYLGALCAAIEQQLEGVALEVEADEIDLLIDRAVPLGLIVNEAVTNSVKHAFGDNGGVVAVRLTGGVGRGEARLTVSDNGRGVDPAKPTGTGSRLIESLAAQIGGTIHRESSDKGTKLSVQFPIVT
jgi:two-component sensor histidine kinase